VRTVLASVVCVLFALAAGAWESASSGAARSVDQKGRTHAPSVELRLSRSQGGKHDRFTVNITTRRTTGVRGQTRTNYSVTAKAVHAGIACVNDRDQRFPDARAGTHVRATLDPARGKGGPEGWCRGVFRGAVTYFEGYACPPKGTCHVPPGFPTRTVIVGRFSFRVR
jgi:hypothetical protein